MSITCSIAQVRFAAHARRRRPILRCLAILGLPAQRAGQTRTTKTTFESVQPEHRAVWSARRQAADRLSRALSAGRSAERELAAARSGRRGRAGLAERSRDQGRTHAQARRRACARPAIREDDGKPLAPARAQRAGPSAGAGRTPNPTGPADRDNRRSRTLNPIELGYKGGCSASLFKERKPNVVHSEGEPPRSSLTEPPPGYQTPSPSQPYGLTARQEGRPKPYELLADARRRRLALDLELRAACPMRR